MLKIDVIHFEAQDVVASSTPDMNGNTNTDKISIGDTTTSGGSSGGSSDISSDSPNMGLFS